MDSNFDSTTRPPSPGSSSREPTGPYLETPPAVPVVPGYQELREIGRGGMGVVYLAFNCHTCRDEVLKVMSQRMAGSPGAEQRFQREIQAAARLRHENVVTIYAVLTAQDGSLAYAMEYVPGRNLAEIVTENGPLPIAMACEYIAQAAQGLHHAHQNGLVHRDIKPHNLLLEIRERMSLVKILDFGLVKQLAPGNDEALTHQDVLLGTVEYVAPEQARDASTVDLRADVYSLGATLFFLLTGRSPFLDGKRTAAEILLAHAMELPVSVRELRPEVPPGVEHLLTRMLAKDPAERPRTADDICKALTAFRSFGSPAQPQTEKLSCGNSGVRAPGAKPARGRQRTWSALLGLSAILALVAGLYTIWSRVPVQDSSPPSPPPQPIRPFQFAGAWKVSWDTGLQGDSPDVVEDTTVRRKTLKGDITLPWERVGNTIHIQGPNGVRETLSINFDRQDELVGVNSHNVRVYWDRVTQAKTYPIRFVKFRDPVPNPNPEGPRKHGWVPSPPARFNPKLVWKITPDLIEGGHPNGAEGAKPGWLVQQRLPPYRNFRMRCEVYWEVGDGAIAFRLQGNSVDSLTGYAINLKGGPKMGVDPTGALIEIVKGKKVNGLLGRPNRNLGADRQKLHLEIEARGKEIKVKVRGDQEFTYRDNKYEEGTF